MRAFKDYNFKGKTRLRLQNKYNQRQLQMNFDDEE